jgi:hypothetical protein
MKISTRIFAIDQRRRISHQHGQHTQSGSGLVYLFDVVLAAYQYPILFAM